MGLQSDAAEKGMSARQYIANCSGEHIEHSVAMPLGASCYSAVPKSTPGHGIVGTTGVTEYAGASRL